MFSLNAKRCKPYSIYANFDYSPITKHNESALTSAIYGVLSFFPFGFFFIHTKCRVITWSTLKLVRFAFRANSTSVRNVPLSNFTLTVLWAGKQVDERSPSTNFHFHFSRDHLNGSNFFSIKDSLFIQQLSFKSLAALHIFWTNKILI